MISIIIPIYNAEKYLVNSINSVINQNFQDWKLILVNDGSTDASLDICEKYINLDSRIQVFTQENKGQSAARNFGLSKIETEFVMFLDADDELEEETLLLNVEILKNNPDIECLQFPVYRDYGTDKQEINMSNPEFIIDNFWRSWLVEKKISWIACDKIYKASIFKNQKFVEGIVYEDNLFVAQLLNSITNIYISDQGLYYYYTRENSTMTSPVSLKKERDSFFVTSEITKLLITNKEYDLAINFYIRLINIQKSLKFNFKDEVKIESKIKNEFSMSDILKSKLSLKEMLKVLIQQYAN